MKFDPDANEVKRLTLAGMPGYLMKERPFKLKKHVSNYTSSTDGMTPKAVKASEQIEDYETMMEDPVHAPYISCISSDPNDLQAKLLAASIMLEAQRQGYVVHWHTVVGGFKDPMRDKRVMFAKKELVILANVPYLSTDTKWEKVRDILELFSDVPRIVVSTGCEPIKLFNEIGYHLNYPIWLRSQRAVRVI